MSLQQAKPKLDEIERRYNELESQMNDPEFSSDYQRYLQAKKSQMEIEGVALAYQKYRQVLADIPEAEEMLSSSAETGERELGMEMLELSKGTAR